MKNSLRRTQSGQYVYQPGRAWPWWAALIVPGIALLALLYSLWRYT
jgi:hypothetical protein